MKNYTTIGELLKDYRKLNNISQADLSARLNVDNRTLIRWENNETLIKSDKEEELVEETFIPYQVIRNLNANVAIPTFYDFRLRKYSYSKLSIELPKASWFKEYLNIDSLRSRAISNDSDAEHISRYLNFFYPPNAIKTELILEAARILPELNHILFDTSGYYAGHCVIFPIKKEIYEKIRNKEMSERELNSSCFTRIKPDEETIFYAYNITADCNENLFYIICPVLNYFQEYRGGTYKFASYALRKDGFELVEQLGLKLIWEEEKKEVYRGLEFLPRFYEGDFKEFFFGNH